MEISIIRNLSKHYELTKMDWKIKTIKPIVMLSITLLIGVSMLTLYIFDTNYRNYNKSTFNLVTGIILITYSLTCIRIYFAAKAQNLRDKKLKLLQGIEVFTTIILTDDTVTVSNDLHSSLFKWEYFKIYKPIKNNIFISANKNTLGFSIALDELSHSEYFSLIEVMKKKGLKNIK